MCLHVGNMLAVRESLKVLAPGGEGAGGIAEVKGVDDGLVEQAVLVCGCSL